MPQNSTCSWPMSGRWRGGSTIGRATPPADDRADGYAGLAVLLAAVGSLRRALYFVSQHQAEIGIRIALGALAAMCCGWCCERL